MCYLQLSLRLNNKKINSDIDELLKKTICEEMDYNRDGYFMRVGDNKLRTVDRVGAELALLDVDTNGLMVHSRLGTTGELGLHNVHGWSIGGWELFHNGFAYNTETEHLKGDTDSLVMFKKIMQKLKGLKNDKPISNAIKKIAGECGFQGRAILYNHKKKEAFLFGDFYTYLINDNYIVVTSCSQDFEELSQSVVAGGLHFEKAKEIKFNVVDRKIDGIYKLSGIGSDGVMFKYLDSLDLPKYTAYSYTKKDGMDKYEDWDDLDEKPPKPVDRIYLDNEGSYTTQEMQEFGFWDVDDNYFNYSEIVNEDLNVEQQQLELERLDSCELTTTQQMAF